MTKTNKYVYVVSKSEMKVVDTASDVAQLKKRIEKKNYPDDVLFVNVLRYSCLSHLSTDEQLGADFLDSVLASAIVSGVDCDTAITRLAEKDQIKLITLDSDTKEKSEK